MSSFVQWFITILLISGFLVGMIGYLPSNYGWYPYAFVDLVTGMGVFFLLIQSTRVSLSLSEIALALKEVVSVMNEQSRKLDANKSIAQDALERALKTGEKVDKDG